MATSASDEVQEFIVATLERMRTEGEIGGQEVLGDVTALVGEQAVIDSRGLVELLIALEEFAEDHGGQFDWADDAAMSATKSPLRTVRTLAEFVASQVRS